MANVERHIGSAGGGQVNWYLTFNDANGKVASGRINNASASAARMRVELSPPINDIDAFESVVQNGQNNSYNWPNNLITMVWVPPYPETPDDVNETGHWDMPAGVTIFCAWPWTA